MDSDSNSITWNQSAIDRWKIERVFENLLDGFGDLDQAACDRTAKLDEIEG
jgi:hypothetical protein